jgi:hypothetical protein
MSRRSLRKTTEMASRRAADSRILHSNDLSVLTNQIVKEQNERVRHEDDAFARRRSC